MKSKSQCPTASWNIDKVSRLMSHRNVDLLKSSFFSSPSCSSSTHDIHSRWVHCNSEKSLNLPFSLFGLGLSDQGTHRRTDILAAVSRISQEIRRRKMRDHFGTSPTGIWQRSPSLKDQIKPSWYTTVRNKINIFYRLSSRIQSAWTRTSVWRFTIKVQLSPALHSD